MAGRPKYQPDKTQRALVALLAGAGVLESRIAERMGIDAKTLRKHFRAELAQGHLDITVQAVSTLVRAMSNGGREAVAAACFWLKCRERWTEVQRTEVSGVGGEPISSSVKVIVEYDRKSANLPDQTA